METTYKLQPKVDLLVVNYNTKEKLERLLNVVHSDDDGLWDLHVAENDSPDDSREFLEASRDRYRIANIDFNENIGYARAINKLARNSTAPYLAILNGDVWFTSSDVSSMIDFMDANPEVGACGPKQRDEKGFITHAGIFGSHEGPKHRGWRERDPQDKRYRDVKECITISGSALFFRRETWDGLMECDIYQKFHEDSLHHPPEGPMPSFKHYFEETLAMYHLSAHPNLGKVVYNGTVSIGHSWRSSSKSGDSYTREGFVTGKKLFRKFCKMHSIRCD